MGILRTWLEHPLTRGLSIDDPCTTLLRRRIIQKKVFLRRLYDEWYSLIQDRLPTTRDVLELGSGAGFLSDRLPGIITSEVFETPGVDLVIDARQLPFANHSLDAIVMTDVFHHIPDVCRFLHEACRCLHIGGRVVMIEPWRTPWSEWVYSRLHHEPFLPAAEHWYLRGGGALSVANGALPWIVFSRDRQRFQELFPSLQILSIRPFMPLAYTSNWIKLRFLILSSHPSPLGSDRHMGCNQIAVSSSGEYISSQGVYPCAAFFPVRLILWSGASNAGLAKADWGCSLSLN